jgi:hypothetical protein
MNSYKKKATFSLSVDSEVTVFLFKRNNYQTKLSVNRTRIVTMNKPLIPILRVLAPLHAVPPTGESRQYHGVAIRYYDPCACAAVQRMETKPFLWNKPPLYLETKRFLSGEAPPLPLPNCTAPRCLCCYAHYEDRREGDRRIPLSPDFFHSSFFVGLERRMGTIRRQLCVAS